MAKRLPSAPPNLPGFTYVRALGAGGFADVFLYEQNMPRRQVAVKVLLAEVVTPSVRSMFQIEANLMAQLSAHPAVLTVYQASVAADGRPYIVMELCSPQLGQRYRVEPLSVPEALSVGIRIAGAVETAHRAGMLHRDVKPSNILTTAYGHPVLSDFGIAATVGDAELADAVGMSVPWSAPEVLADDTSGTVASEVWSLGATIYSLIAGRSPFEVVGTDNTTAQLIGRIQRAKPQPIDRADVPPRLEAVLGRTMAKKPEARQQSVIELIRDLQSIEAELGFAPTPADVPSDGWVAAIPSADDDRTVVRPFAREERRRFRIDGAASGATPAQSRETGASTRPRASTRLSVGAVSLIAACAVLAAAFVVTLAIVLTRAGSTADIPVVRNIDGRVTAEGIRFHWDDPGIAHGDEYQVSVDGAAPSLQQSTSFTVDSAARRVCLTVTVNRSGRTGEQSIPKCVDPAGDQ
ncbi:serine/threonine-protein kinase [Humibacter ginsenosidimutans]|uniref:non-specific serine/threonine protein kinase n=1 Tax=Humibacter ginsenosidimutans TaxID=2599293 RepID=A0A5B8M810_9MICO|nr:serine/threonine-protein kinase [Humibacter ginsenosidimutans]QDZ16563.1 serine/threonine protein kinase [Humibacter ginsenosidimutans]